MPSPKKKDTKNLKDNQKVVAEEVKLDAIAVDHHHDEPKKPVAKPHFHKHIPGDDMDEDLNPWTAPKSD